MTERDHATLLDKHIAAIVSEAPPLTTDQVDLLRALFAPVRDHIAPIPD